MQEEDVREKERKAREAQILDERQKIQEARDALPIRKWRDGLLQAIEQHQIIIIVGETGSGKTTQVTFDHQGWSVCTSLNSCCGRLRQDDTVTC